MRRGRCFFTLEFELEPVECDCSNSASRWIHTNTKYLCLSLFLSDLNKLKRILKMRPVCVCVHYQGNPSLSVLSAFPRCTVQLARPNRERAPFFSPHSDSQQKCSSTCSSGFCGSFVLRHRLRTQNGSGGNPTPHPRVSQYPCQSSND